MDNQTVIDEFKVKRSSVIKDEYLLILFSVLLYFQIDNYINLSRTNDPSIVTNSIVYVVLFMALACLYYPKKINLNQKIIFIVSALIFRLRALFYLPVLSSDLHRNLLFGSVLADGWNPYFWTIQNLPALFTQGLIPKVSYTTDWATHSFDYPSLAILFFAMITFLVPPDNFSAIILAKLVLMIVDVINAYLIYRILTVHFNLTEASKKTAFLYLINPLSIFWVNIEGQFEPIPLFFILISFYLLFYLPSGNSTYSTNPNQNLITPNKKYYIKFEYFPYVIGFTLGCGVLFKFFPLVFAVPIIFYFGKNIKAIFNFVFSLCLTVIFLSFPFILNSYYVSNFILFQLIRSNNTISDANYDIGFSIFLPIVLIMVIMIGFLFYYSLKDNFDKKLQTSILGLFSVLLFIYINNSIFSWYAIWIFGTLLFINSNHDEFYRSLLWVLSSIILIFIWKPDFIILVIWIIIVSYFVTLDKFRSFMRVFINKL